MKKHQQLGMNAGTASHRLVKDLLFDFVQRAGHRCHRCGKPLARSNFSIEHIRSWLDSDDPVRNFFDISNIGYSHLSCNSAASGLVRTKYADQTERKRLNRAAYEAKNPGRRRKLTPEASRKD